MLRGAAMDEQKSAEVIVAAAHRGEGPNMRSRIGSKHWMSEQDVVQKDEKPAGPQLLRKRAADLLG